MDDDSRRVIEESELRGLFKYVDGMWYFDPSNATRLYLDWSLRVIADELERRNTHGKEERG